MSDAIELFEAAYNSSSPYRLVITDLMMPYRKLPDGTIEEYKDGELEYGGVLVAKAIKDRVRVYAFSSVPPDKIKSYVTSSGLFTAVITKEGEEIRHEQILSILGRLEEDSRIEIQQRRIHSGRDFVNWRIAKETGLNIDAKEADNLIMSYAHTHEMDTYEVFTKLKESYEFIDAVISHVSRKTEAKRQKALAKELLRTLNLHALKDRKNK